MNAKNIVRKWILCCLCCSLLFSFLPFPTLAAEDPIPLPSLENAAAVYLYHLESETLVASKAENESVGAGSSVKVMSGLLFCELLEERLSESLSITADMLDELPAFTGRSLHIQEGDTVTVEQLLYAAICGSYNDAFYLLSVHLCGTVDAFLTLMNQRAADIGAQTTIFDDLTGIVDGSRTTASDMALIARAAYENPLYMKLCNTVSYYFSSDLMQKTIYNRNALICSNDTPKYYNKYCRGMSAGTTTKDGNCVITVAKHQEETYISVVLGGAEVQGVEYGYRITNLLIDWVYAAYSYIEIISPKTELCTIPITVSDFTNEVAVRTDKTLHAYLPKGTQIGSDITYSIRLTNTSLEAPVSEGTFVGYVAIIYQDRVLGTVELYTVEGAERSGVISSLKSIQSWIENRAVRAGVIFFVVILSAWLIAESVFVRRRRQKWDKYFSSKMELSEKLINEDKKRDDRK